MYIYIYILLIYIYIVTGLNLSNIFIAYCCLPYHGHELE